MEIGKHIKMWKTQVLVIEGEDDVSKAYFSFDNGKLKVQIRYPNSYIK